MKKYLGQLIDLQNEKLAQQTATIRHLQAELLKHGNGFSLSELEIEDTVRVYGQTYTLVSRNRAAYEITLRRESAEE